MSTFMAVVHAGLSGQAWHPPAIVVGLGESGNAATALKSDHRSLRHCLSAVARRSLGMPTLGVGMAPIKSNTRLAAALLESSGTRALGGKQPVAREHWVMSIGWHDFQNA